MLCVFYGLLIQLNSKWAIIILPYKESSEMYQKHCCGIAAPFCTLVFCTQSTRWHTCCYVHNASSQVTTLSVTAATVTRRVCVIFSRHRGSGWLCWDFSESLKWQHGPENIWHFTKQSEPVWWVTMNTRLFCIQRLTRDIMCPFVSL